MKRELDAPHLEFCARVEAFVDEHWDAEPVNVRVARWREAVVAAGWSVPGWPESAGGPGWDATQRYLWASILARRGVDLPPETGVDVVGPLLLTAAPASMQTALLPGIREIRESWCVGAAELGGLDLRCLATRAARKEEAGSAFYITGEKHYVRGAAAADWMLCLAALDGGTGLFAVAMSSQGVAVKPTPTFDGDASLALVVLDDVRVPAELGCVLEDTDAAMRCLSGTPALAAGALAGEQLAAVRSVIAEWHDEDLTRRADELGVAVEALKAMELRYVEAADRGVAAPFPEALLRARSRELLLQLGDLQVESFGYYALPYPDEALLHNEGPIGPAGATAAIRRSLSVRIALQHEAAAAVPPGTVDWLEGLKDQLAREMGLGGLDRSTDGEQKL